MALFICGKETKHYGNEDKNMKEMAERVYNQLEAEDTLWKELEASEEYASINNELHILNQQIKEILEEKLEKKGRTLLNDQEQLYYKLLSVSQKYFYQIGYNMGSKK